MPARARVRCGPREQRERERGDELEHFYHKSQRLGSAHSIFSKTPGGAAAISSAKPPSPKSSSQDRAAHGDADGTAEIAHHVEQAACVFEALRRQAAEAQSHRRGYCENLREPAQDLRQQKLESRCGCG